jgi:hypothetical protein
MVIGVPPDPAERPNAVPGRDASHKCEVADPAIASSVLPGGFDKEDTLMTSLRTLSLAVLLVGGIPAAGFAVTGRDAEGNPNGTPGTLTGPPQNQPGASGQAAQNEDPRKKDIQEHLTDVGYSQVRDINFGAEVTTAKAVKDGKEWLLVIDSHGKVQQQPQ